LGLLRHSDGEQRRRDAISELPFQLLWVRPRYEYEARSLDEHSSNFRPEPQPEHGYAFSGDDAQRPTLYGLRPVFFSTQKHNTITNNPAKQFSPEAQPVAWIGLDWGDKEHAFLLRDGSGHEERDKLQHSAENLHGWLRQIGERYGGRPVALAIEASRGAVIHALLQYAWLIIYPINPVTSARYRTAFRPSGAKDDLPDADVLFDLVRVHADKLRVLEPQDPETVQLTGLVEARRRIVDRRTAVLNELTALLKSYYPQALQLFGDLNSDLAVDFLRRWPDLISLKAAKPGTIKRFYYQHQVRSTQLLQQRLAFIAKAVALTTDEVRVSVARLQLNHLLDQLKVFHTHVAIFDDKIKTTFATHSNAALFRELPGAGPQLAPRLCAAFGTITSLYPDPASLQKYAGLAPVREKSGNQTWIHWRWRAPTFLRQTFVEWAGQTVRYSEWAKVYYQRMLRKGKKHTVILRALAFKWIRVLWKCWQDRKPYHEAQYLKQLIHRKSPNALSVSLKTTTVANPFSMMPNQ
jgi:transposase